MLPGVPALLSTGKYYKDGYEYKPEYKDGYEYYSSTGEHISVTHLAGSGSQMSLKFQGQYV